MTWQEALKCSGTTVAHQSLTQATLFAPGHLHRRYALRLAVIVRSPDGVAESSQACYYAATAQGCDRLLEEMAVSKTGWKGIAL